MRKFLLLYLPSIFNKDGNHNLSGLLFISILFSCTYYGINFVLNQFILDKNLFELKNVPGGILQTTLCSKIETVDKYEVVV